MAASNEPVVLGRTAQPITGTAKTKAAPKSGAVRVGGAKAKAPAKKAKAPKAHASKRPAGNPGAQVAPGLTAGQLAKLTGAAVGQKYGGAQQQLAAQPARINNWYTQYQNAIQGAKAQSAASYQNAVNGVAKLQAGLDNSSREQWAGQQGQMSADAANRGASTDPTLADQVHNASSVRNMLTGSFGAQFLGQGAAQNAYMGNRFSTAGQQRVEALGANAQQMQQLQKDKGTFAQTFRQDAIDTASKNYLNNALAAASLGQKAVQTQSIKATTQKTKTDTKTAALKNQFLGKYGRLPSTTDPNTPSARLDQWRLDYAQKHGHLPGSGARPGGTGSSTTNKDPYGNTQSQRTTRQSAYRKIQIDARQFAEVAAHKVPGWDVMSNSARAAKLYQAIAPDYATVDIDIIRGAIQKALLGRVGPHIKKSLTHQGVKAR